LLRARPGVARMWEASFLAKNPPIEQFRRGPVLYSLVFRQETAL